MLLQCVGAVAVGVVSATAVIGTFSVISGAVGVIDNTVITARAGSGRLWLLLF